MAKGLDALVIAAGPPKMKGGSDGDDLESPAGAKVRAARRMRQAIERKDDAALADAYKEMYKICAAEHGPGEDDDAPLDDDEGGEEY